MASRSEHVPRGLDVLFLAEDPGAANFIAPLLGPLQERGIEVAVAARGYAQAIFDERGVGFISAEGDVAKALLGRCLPRVVVTGSAGNHNPLTAAVLLAAKRRAIVTVGVVDARMNARERWRGGSEDALHLAPDWLLVPDQWTVRAFLKLGFRRERMAVVGYPHYDYVQAVARRLSRQGRAVLKRCLFPRRLTGKCVLTFVTEGSQRARAREDQPRLVYEWETLPARAGRVEVALAALMASIEHLPAWPYLVLCVHPKDRVGDYEPAVRAFDFVRTHEPMLEVLYASDVVVGLTSMALAEAALLGRPVISILPRAAERAWLPLAIAEYARCVASQAQLGAALELFRAGELAAPRVSVVPSVDRAVEALWGVLARERTVGALTS